MTVLYSVATGSTVLAADVNQFKSMLEGASGYTSTYLLVSTTGTNFLMRLGDAAGVNKFSIQDSASVEQFSVTSDGVMSVTSLTPTALVLPTSASPSQTTEGQVIWDSDDDVLTIGDGASRKTIYPGIMAKLLVNVATPTSTTSTSQVDLLNISTDINGNALAIPVTAGLRIIFQTRKQAIAANYVGFGLKINTTVVIDASSTGGATRSSAANQAEDGLFVIDILPRSANYLNGVGAYGGWRVSASGVQATAAAFISALTAPMPNAVITNIIIRAINDTASNVAEVNSVQVWQLGS